MKKTSIFLLFSLMLTCFSSYSQERLPYTSNNEVFLKIFGTEQDYEFISNNLKTGMDRGRKQFEFVLPMETLRPLEDPLHLQILRSVFPAQSNPTILLTATLNEATATLKDFAEPTRIVLNGVLTLNEERFYLPIELSIYVSGDDLFYNMIARFDLALLDRTYEGTYKNIITGEFALYVNDASWNDLFPE